MNRIAVLLGGYFNGCTVVIPYSPKSKDKVTFKIPKTKKTATYFREDDTEYNKVFRKRIRRWRYQ